MWTLAGNVWSFFHRFALGTAILSGRNVAGTNGMSAFLTIIGCHMCVSFFEAAEGLDASQSRKDGAPGVCSRSPNEPDDQTDNQ